MFATRTKFDDSCEDSSPQLSIKKTPRYISRRIVFTLLSAIITIGGGGSFYLVLRWKVESDIARDQMEQMDFLIAENINEDTDDENLESEPEEQTQEPESSTTPTRTLSEMNFQELKTINSSTIGWIKVNNSRIDYPIVHSDDNEYYLKHSFNRSLSSSGAIFLDYRNKTDFNNKNSIIYGHGRNEGTMFGTLKNALNASWQNNPENHIITIDTENGILKYQIFSVYRIPNTNDYIRTLFRNSADFSDFLAMLKNRSVHDFGVPISSSDKILTLSTCIGLNSAERMVVHAKLIN